MGTRKHDPRARYGTYLFLADNGAVIRVTVHEEGWDEYFVIKEADEEK